MEPGADHRLEPGTAEEHATAEDQAGGVEHRDQVGGGVAEQLGLDVKTVRRYLAIARAHGLEQTHGLAALDDELVAAVAAAAQPGRGRSRGEGWAVCETHRGFIEQRLDQGVRLTKIRKLLLRQGVEIEYPTLHRFAVAQLDFGHAPPTVPVADCKPGEEIQVDTGWMTLPWTTPARAPATGAWKSTG